MLLKRTAVIILILLILLPMVFILFTATASAFIGEEARDNILSLFQGLMLFYLLNYFNGETEVKDQEDSSQLPDDVHFIQETSLEFNSDQVLTEEEIEFYGMLNEAREELGLSPLKLDWRLVEEARIKARDLSVGGYFDHTSPRLGTPFDQMQRAGIDYSLAGENIASGLSVQRVHQGLMESISHRENILRDRYTHTGVGVIIGPSGKMYVQLFIEV